MQTRRSTYQTHRRTPKKRSDLLDQKWLTYFLAFVLILLVAIFVASVKYKKEMIQYIKNLLNPKKEVPRPRPRLLQMERFETQNLTNPFPFWFLPIPSNPLTSVAFPFALSQ